MARGSPRVTIRVEPLLLHEIHLAMDSANLNRREAPYTISDWIKAQIIAGLKHLERGRKCRTGRGRKEATQRGKPQPDNTPG